MAHDFDAGPVGEPFATLAREYPGAEVYPPADFRVEWGPIFHRGRLDGSARVLIVGQDPGQHESIARRILVGEAGQRVQGFLGKLGLERSYVMLNAFLYSVYGQEGGERHADDDAIAGYRERWFGALLETARLEAVVAFGSLARAAVERWRTHDSRARAILFEPLIHPTFPDASSGGSGPAFGRAMREMLAQWNQALRRLDEAIGPRDVDRELALYGRALRKSDVAAIPAADLPAGTPEWMRSPAEWAVRRGRSAEEKRATVVVTVPAGARPWRE